MVAVTDPEAQAIMAFAFINIITFIILLFFNSPAPEVLGIYKNGVANVSRESEVDITPAGGTFAIWGLIYLWQLAWLCFNIAILFLTTNGGYVFLNPIVLNSAFQILIFSNFFLNIIWLFLFDRKLFTASFVVLFLLAGTLYGALVFSHLNTYNARKTLSSNYVWAYRILVNNGVAFYATWLTVATLLAFSIAFTYEWTNDPETYRSTSSLISLSILVTVVFVYFLFDVWIFEPILRYTYSVYLCLAIAIAVNVKGILVKNWPKRTASAIFALVIAVFCLPAMIIIKLVLSIYYGSLDGYV